MFLFPSTWPGFASLGQIIHPPKKPVLAISLPSSAVCVTLSPRQLVLLGNLFVGLFVSSTAFQKGTPGNILFLLKIHWA